MKKWMEFSLNRIEGKESTSYLGEYNYKEKTYEIVIMNGGSSSIVPGKVGSALHMTDGYLSIREKNKNGTYKTQCFSVPQSFSWAAWINIDTSNTTYEQEIISIDFPDPESPASKYSIFRIQTTKDGNVSIFVTLYTSTLASSRGFTVDAYNGINFGEWNHIAFTYDSINRIGRIYINGKEKGYYKNNLTGYTIPNIENAEIKIGNSLYGKYTKKISNVIFGDDCWTSKDIEMLAEPILAYYPLRFKKYPIESLGWGIYQCPPIKDCKQTRDKRNITIKGESSDGGYNIINIENTSLTGRNLGAFVLSEYALWSYEDFFSNLDHYERTISFWYNLDIYNKDKTFGCILFLEMGNYALGIYQDRSDFNIKYYEAPSQGYWTWEENILGSPFYAKRFDTKTLSDYDTYRLFTLTYNGSVLKIYLDGELEFSKNISGNIDGGFYMGNKRDWTSEGCSKIRISDMKIFAKELSKEEIEKIYNKEDIEIDVKNKTFYAGEFIETSSTKILPKGVVCCKEIQENEFHSGDPKLTTDGILRMKEFIEI